MSADNIAISGPLACAVSPRHLACRGKERLADRRQPIAPPRDRGFGAYGSPSQRPQNDACGLQRLHGLRHERHAEAVSREADHGDDVCGVLYDVGRESARGAGGDDLETMSPYLLRSSPRVPTFWLQAIGSC
jgi:hypothetical protein